MPNTKKPQAPVIVFSDLDGTLLDKHSYQFDAALPAMRQLKAAKIPLILCSSKTGGEIHKLCQAMDCNYPFIAENGGAVYLPDSYFNPELTKGLTTTTAPAGSQITGYQAITTSCSRDFLLQTLDAIRQQTGFEFIGFNDMDLPTLARHTGLSESDCNQAKQRFFSEPLIWLGSDAELNLFKNKIHQAGLRLISGGRFYHVMGKFDKADALKMLSQLYQQQWQQKPTTIALGDSPNDLDMLLCADISVVIKTDTGHRLTLQKAKSYYSESQGPRGWNETLLHILKHDIDGI